LAGCAPAIYTDESILTATPTPSPSLASASPNATLTLTSVPVHTQTVIPTLPTNQANIRLLELLANNGNCQLPCIWGITPGKSIHEEAENLLIPLSSISEFTNLTTSPGDILPTYFEGDNILYTRMAFLFPEGEVISHVALQIRILKKIIAPNGESSIVDAFDSTPLGEKIEYYALSTVLARYGNPTTVMLSTMAKLPSSGVPGGFKILLLYPDHGMLVNYTMQMQISGENIMGCPSNAVVELELYPSGQADSFFDLLEPSGWAQIIQNTYKPLDDATLLSQEDFYRIFSQQSDECLRTPANIWPVPD